MKLQMFSSCAVAIGLLGGASASGAQPTNVNGLRAESTQQPASSPKRVAPLKAAPAAAVQPHARPSAVQAQDRRERATRVASKVLKSTQESASAVAGNVK